LKEVEVGKKVIEICRDPESATPFFTNGLRVLKRIIELRGHPEAITSDNDPQLNSIVMNTWAHENGIKLDLIRPG
jgi:hypothetical protein